MRTLQGYHIAETISSTGKSIVYRGRRLTQNGGEPEAVIIKIPASERPTARELAWLKHELDILGGIDHPGVVRALRVEKAGGSLALIREDTGGLSLDRYLRNGRLDTGSFLGIALQLADALEAIHRAGVIHKDVKPANIIYHPERNEARLTDFSFSSRLDRETADSEGRIEGTLAYISPEQTGRMNRSVDYRTDLYSLGATFYEMLSGRRPFEATDAMELIHCHIARFPVEPEDVSPVLSGLVMKLLAKSPEDRYRSAAGLKHDLTRLRDGFLATGRLEEIVYDDLDDQDRFVIPEKLYGREKEIEQILAMFARICQGESELMLVSGTSGIGKTALVNEVHKPLAAERGHFLSGKFDQYKQDIPHASIIQAFQSLIRGLLSESEASVAAWRTKIRAALGEDGRVITEVIPELELILGEQPEPTALPAAESRNRFHRLLLRFVQVFAAREHPLILFLDDLQWADPPSLHLIEMLLCEPVRYLFIIGAYRDNEVDPAHPLTLAVQRIERQVPVVDIRLRSPGAEHLDRLIRDVFRCDARTAAELRRIVQQKTDGNPFFVRQFLATLHQDGLVRTTATGWTWEIAEIVGANITDNVVDLMATKIRRLERTARDLLATASLIGSKFTLETLALAENRPAADLQNDLWPAVKQGYVTPLNEDYKLLALDQAEFLSSDTGVPFRFQHDRVQQAAYSLIPEQERAALHLRIGRLLLKGTPADRLEDQLFEVVNHLNFGQEEFGGDERANIVELNLRAARKARHATAYRAAARYARAGLALVEPDSDGHTRLQLHRELGEAELLEGHFETADEQFQAALEAAETREARAEIYRRLTVLQTGQSRFRQAIQTGIEGLRLFGIEFSLDSAERQVLTLLKQVRKRTADRDILEIADLPPLADPTQQAIIDQFVAMTAGAYFTDTYIASIIALNIALISLEYGNTAASAWGYINVGTTLVPFGDMEGVRKYGELAIRLNEKYDGTAERCRILCMYGFYNVHWSEHARENIRVLEEAYHYGVQTGDQVYASLALIDRAWVGLQLGSNLAVLADQTAEAQTYFRKYSFDEGLRLTDQVLYLCALLRDEDFAFDDEEQRAALNASEMPFALHLYYVSRLFLDCHLNADYHAALEHAAEALKLMNFSAGMLHLAEQKFFHGLTLTALIPTADEATSKLHRKQIEKDLKLLKTWAEACPANFEHKRLLLEAELAGLDDDDARAMELYDRAIESAREHDYLRNAGIAAERAAEFYQRRGRRKIARLYLSDALWDYEQIGARGKIRKLREQWTELLSSPHAYERRAEGDSSSDSTSLDLDTIVRAAQEISGEIVQSNLLRNILKIILENAGAERGLLIMAQDDGYRVEAEGGVRSEPLLRNIPLDLYEDFSRSVFNYVTRTRENLVLHDATDDERFRRDAYIEKIRPRSILCSPIVHQGKLLGALYLENNLTAGAFSPQRIEIVKVLGTQAAISIENARLYAHLEEKVAARTRELQTAKELAERSNEEITALNNFSKTLNTMVDLDMVLDRIFAYLRNHYPVEGIIFGLVSSDKKEIIFHRATMPESFPAGQLAMIRSLRIPLLEEGDNDVTSMTYHRKRATVMPKLRGAQSRIDRLYQDDFQVQSTMHVPLILQNEVVAMIVFASLSRPVNFRTYARSLERFCDQIAGAINSSRLLNETRIAHRMAEAERTKADDLLLNVLPRQIAEELKTNGEVEPLFYESVSVMFTDFKDFTRVSETKLPQELVGELDRIFLQFDHIVERYNIEKLKTIGDAYMCAGGLPAINATHPVDICRAALEILAFMEQTRQLTREISNADFWEIRIGIHTGPVMAGVIGKHRFTYDIWGDSVNVASRMESNGTPGRINISEDTYRQVRDFFVTEYRGELHVKNKGEMAMYYLDRIRPELSRDEEGRVPNERFDRLYAALRGELSV